MCHKKKKVHCEPSKTHMPTQFNKMLSRSTITSIFVWPTANICIVLYTVFSLCPIEPLTDFTIYQNHLSPIILRECVSSGEDVSVNTVIILRNFGTILAALKSKAALSVVQLKGKHCRHRVVDTYMQYGIEHTLISILQLIIFNSTLIFRPPSHCHRFLQVLSRFLGKKIEKGLTNHYTIATSYF